MTDRGTHPPLAAIAAASAVAALAYLGLYALTARSVLNPDPFVMARVAREVIAGKRLYAEAWDNKAPLCILFYAIPEWLAPRSYAAIQVFAGMGALVQAAAALFYTRGASPAARSAAVAVLLLGPLSRFEYAWASSQDSANLFVAIALFASLHVLLRPTHVARDCFVAGVATALAFHARQNCLLFGLFPALAVLLVPEARARWVRAAAALAAGGIAGGAVVLALMAAVGDLRGYVYTVFVAPRRYVGEPAKLIELLGFIRNDAMVLVVIASLAALLPRRRELVFAAALAAVGVVSIVSPMRDHYYYWAQLLPVASALVFLALREQSPRAGRLAAGVLSAFLAGNAAWTVAKCVLRPTMRDSYAVARELDALAPADATFFAVGRDAAPLDFASRRPSANPLFWDNYLFGPPSQVTPKPTTAVLAEYESAPPDLLVVDEDVIDAIEHSPPGSQNAAWELVRRYLDSGRYEPAGRHAGQTGGAATASWRYYRLCKRCTTSLR